MPPSLPPAPRLSAIQTRQSLVPPPATQSDPDYDRRWTYFFEIYELSMVRYVQCILPSHMIGARRYEEARETTAAFVAHALASNVLGNWRGEGRFSAFLKTLLYRYAVDTYRKAKRKRSAPGSPLVDIDDEEVATHDDDAFKAADAEFYRGVLVTALRRVLKQLALEGGRLKNGPRYSAIVRWRLGEVAPELSGSGSEPPEFTAGHKCAALKVVRELLEKELRRLPLHEDDVQELLSRFKD